MADLLDIAPSTACEAVWIGEQRIIVRGLSVDAIASIIARFPELRALVNGGGDIVASVISACGKAVGPIIAAGCGHIAEDAYEQHAARLLPEQQLKLLKPIFGLTFPNGLSSFVEALTGLIGGTGEGAKPIKIRSRNSRSPSSHSDAAPASHQTLQ